MKLAGLRIAAANVRSTESASPRRWLAICRGPSVASSVTVVSASANPSAQRSGSHGGRGGSSAKQRLILPGLPIDEPSSLPVRASSTLRAINRSARPIVMFARLPEPSTL